MHECEIKAQTCPPPDLQGDARAANDRLDRAKDNYALAIAELTEAEREAKRKTNLYLNTLYPKMFI